MRRWYAAALRRTASDIGECESGWELLYRMAEGRPSDLVVASKTLPGLGGAQVLAMLRTADALVPFVLVAPFCDTSTRALVDKLPNAALVEDSLDAVHLVEVAEGLLRSSPARPASQEQVRRAVASCARGRAVHRRRAIG